MAAARVLVCLFALPVGLVCATPSAVGTSGPAAPLPTISISDVTVTEGDSGNVTATFAVTLSAASLDVVTVDYETADGTAIAPADYVSRSGRVTFPVGQTRRNVNVPVHGDTLDEANETFTVDLSSPVNATIADGRGLGRIDDDDPLPALSVDDVSVAEGNSGSVNAVFTVRLSPVSGRAVSVDYATADDTAIAPADYQARSGSLSFPAGQTTRQVSVPVNGDILDEANESFTLDLSGASNAILADGRGVGTINDDDPLPALSIADVAVVEGNSGSVNASFTVTLSPASGRTVTVDYATANGTATAGSDYLARSGTLTFTAGQATRQVTVPVLGDTLDESNETFRVNLSNPVRATIADGQATGTIIDDDGPPALTVQDAAVTEGDAGTVVATVLVTLAPTTVLPVAVDYATADETASAPADYLPAGGRLSFPPGTSTQELTVVVNGDTLDEVDEAFLVNLSGPVNATIADGQASARIVDDDASPEVAIGDASVTEGNSLGSATFTVSLSAVSGRAVTVDYATADVTARAPDDYVAIPPTTLTFPAGETSLTVTVAVVGEASFEPDETFAVNLSNAAGATIADGQGLGSIVNDDAVSPPPPPPPPPPQRQAVRSALVHPPAGAQLGVAPLLVWRPAAKARFYNVQLYRRGQKILSIWPYRPRAKLRPAWTYRGRSFRLRAGAYTWIVWPAFGPPHKPRFGGKLGQSTFRMVRTARA